MQLVKDRLARFSLLFLSLCAGSCRYRQPQFVVVVDTDMEQLASTMGLPPLTDVRITVMQSSGTSPTGDRTMHLSAGALLPRSFGLLPNPGNEHGTVEVRATSVSNGTELFTTRAIVTFPSQGVDQVVLFLADQCRYLAATCTPNQTCGLRGCEDPTDPIRTSYDGDAASDARPWLDDRPAISLPDAAPDVALTDATLDAHTDAPTDQGPACPSRDSAPLCDQPAPAAAWRLQGTLDSNGSAAALHYSPTQPLYVPGLVCQALAFTGSGSAQGPVVSTLVPTDMSMSLWFQWNGFLSMGDQPFIAGFGSFGDRDGGGAGGSFILGISNTGHIAFSQWGEALANPATLTPGSAWHHVVATRTGATIKLYVDGAMVASSSTFRNLAPDYAQPLVLGRIDATDGQSRPFAGAVSDVALFDHPLTDVEVAQLHNDRIANWCP